MEGAGEVQKNIRARESKMKKKILARQLILKIFMLWPKKNSYKESENEKNSCGSKIPLPP